MKVIGLCGGSGSGKSTAALLCMEYGLSVIDADAVYHDMVRQPCACNEQLARAFGAGVLTADGSLNRGRLAQLVFSPPNIQEKKKLLDSITHPLILERVRELLAAYRMLGEDGVVFDAPALFESGFQGECDSVIAVLADEELRIQRITERDRIAREHALGRIRTQPSDDFLKANSQYIIYNNGTKQQLRQALFSVLDQIFK